MNYLRFRVDGVSQVISNIHMREVKISNMLINATYQVMDMIIARANEIAYQGARDWSHGDEQKSIRDSWVKEPIQYVHGYGLETVLKNVSQHACIVGGTSSVSLSSNEQKEICRIKKGDMVLSKDGKQHMVLATKSDMTVKDKPDLVIFNTEKSYSKKGTILTKDHMVLAWNIENEYAYWEEIGNLKQGDYIIKKIKQPWNKGTRAICVCKGCEKPFTVDGYRRKYCSQQCFHSNTNHNHTEGKRWKLSMEIREKRCGKNNPVYIHGMGRSPYSEEWTSVLRDKVKLRDKYTCQECDSIVDLVIHHVDSNKHNNKLSNLVTLCRSCHTVRHWRERDCEFVVIDFTTFKPVKITILEHVNAKVLYSHNNAKLYDINVENENSFIVNGIVVHNSAVELGVHHRIYPKTEGGVLYLGEDFDPPFRTSVAGQKGKYYLTQASNLDSEYLRIWYRYIRSALL